LRFLLNLKSSGGAAATEVEALGPVELSQARLP
jgi:hypothetical protein